MPGQGRLLGAAALIIVGALLPWFYGPTGPVNGMRGPGLWTFYAAMLALAGGLVPPRLRVLAAVQGALTGLIALALPVWQAVHLLQLVGTQGWAPGPGLVMTAAGGVLCFVAARQLFVARFGEPAPAPG
jgi:hypothetical protein